MGFGRGILATPRRGRRLLSEPDAPFGTIVSRFAARNVTVLTPAGTPPFVAPRERSQPPRFPHEEDFYDLVPRHDEPDAPPRRTLITDARDLLLSTLYEMTAVRGEDGQIVPEGSPLLACEVEGMNPQPPELGSPGHVPGWIHVGLTRRAEELLRDAEVQRAARELEWDGRLDSLDGDGYIVLIRMRRPVAPPGSSNGTVTSEGVILPAGWDWEVHAERHVVLVGGSDTATYYAVADFLRRHAGVRWLFPGRLGTVIPEAPSLDLDEPSQLRIEEPDFRGRTLVAISDGGAPRVITPGGAPVLSQTDPEIHDVRNWLLRNRLHPAGERAVLFHRRSLPADHPESPSFAGCVGLPPHTRKYLSLESRIPVGHNLSHFFSPNQSSWDAVSYTTPGATRSEPSAVTYPDPRPQRLAPPDTTPLGTFPAMMEQDEFPCELTQSPVPCTSPNRAVCRCPTEEQTQILGSISDGSFLEVAIRVAPRVGTVCTLPLKVIEDLGRFARTIAVTEMPATRRNVRFIPRTTRATHTQESAPAQGWAPCFFAPASDGRGSETPLAHFRETLAVDLANQLLFLNLNRRVLWRVNDPEFCESLGTDDGEGLWCECVPCRSTNSRDGANGGVLLFKGQAWLRNFHKFENGRNAANTVDLRLRELWLCQDPERLREQALKAHGVLLEAFNELSGRETSTLRDAVGLSRLPTNVGAEELLDVLDRLALRGLLPDRARTHVRSRRFFVFLNKTALAMTRILHEPASYQGRDPLGLGARFVPLGFQPRHTLLTFLTYLDYTAAPLFEKDPLDSSGRAFFYPKESAPRAALAAEFDRSSERAQELAQTVLHPCLTPMISGSRDLLEYDDTKFEGWQRFSAAREAAPFWQHRIAPEQLNHRRWGMVAHQTGIYEWMYGRNTLVPRLYTKRLRNALLTGYEDHHARVFLAEVEPNMGLDSVKLYETARLLWDVKTPPETFYAEFCAALCYPSTSAALAMSLYFQKLEEIWCSREQGYRSHVPPQHRHVSGFNYGTFQGYGILGSAGWITELEPFLRTPTERKDNVVPALGAMPFDDAWQWVDRAYTIAVTERLPKVKDRIQYFRRAFALVGELIRVFDPIWRIWTTVEPLMEYPSLHADPQDWARAWRIANFPDAPLLVGTGVPVPQRIRRELVRGTELVPWATPEGFRREVRWPIHEYLTTSFQRHRERPELGLGLGGIDRSEPDPTRFSAMAPLALQPHLPQAHRAALYMRYVLQYASWWDVEGGNRYPVRPEDHREDQGFGVPMFLSLKKIIAALMILGQQVGDGEIDQRRIDDLMWNA